MAVIIDGKQVAAEIRAEIKQEVERIGDSSGEKVGLAVIMVGDFPASKVYVRLKEKACAEAGIVSVQHNLPEDTSMDSLLDLIDDLNADIAVNGILLQLPLPDALDANEALDRIDPGKDVDGFHPLNVGLLSQNLATLAPCTPTGCIELLDRYKIPIEGANAVVVGRSNIVGKPVAAMLLHRNATVTICHSRTRDLGKITSQADILVVAVGRPNSITEGMVKKGAAVIDVGINRLDNKLVGDVDFNGVVDTCGFISPAPGGVGPMTIAMLLSNTVSAYKLQRNLIVSLLDGSGRRRK
ncbi:MAG TPA: bifunctional methylenetetrahydrofolate dehydrogenase/methenyltetrahydrofolate cyclohydrolase FolD [Nitrospirae bacterium]|nr:bifunctional methylenetetrahydrofolate dehydrogenase/methenyltetrahydrofolate cyclohydrolase FolD [Nitrospirota bacterium]